MALVSLVNLSRFGIAQTCKQMASPLLALAQELAEEEQWGQCISAIDEAIAAEPAYFATGSEESGQVFYLQGIAYMELDQPRDAIRFARVSWGIF